MGANGIVIDSLEKLSAEAIFQAFSDAFSDYEMQLDREELEAMLKRRGFVSKLSFGAFHNEVLVSFTFNGIGEYNGVKSAYDTGTGTIKEFRGQGLATSVFNHSIPYLKEAGVSRYLLEVLQHNKAAVSVYSKLGFEVTRKFNYFSCSMDEVATVEKEGDMSLEIGPIDLSVKEQMKKFWDFQPSWQNDFGSIERSPDDFKMIGAFTEGKMAGYAIFAPKTGDVTQLAVEKSLRRRGIGTVLFREILREISCKSIKVINTETGCHSMALFLKSHSIPLSGTQFEMQKIL